MANPIVLDLVVKPTLDVAAANQVIKTVQVSFGAAAKDFKPIDPNAFKQATTGANEFETELEQLRKKIADLEKGGKSLGGAFQFNQAVQAVSSISAAVNDLSAPLVALDTATAKMRAIGPEAAKMAEGLRSESLAAIREIPFAAAEVMETYNDAIASGVQGGEAEIAKFGLTAGKLATASASDIEASRSVLAGVLNSYQLDAGQSAKVADQLWNTINAGVLSMNDMQASFANVLPTASAMKLGFNDLGGALAYMTQQNIPFAQSTTKVNQLLIEVQKPAKALEPLLKKAGVTGADFARDFAGSLEKLKGAFDASGKSAIQAFSSSDAAAAFNALTGDTEKLKQAIEDVGGQSGTVEASFGQMTDSISVQSKLALNAVESFVTEGISKIGTGVVSAAQAAAQIAPTVTALSGIKDILPEGAVSSFANSIKTKVIPAILSMIPGYTASATAATASGTAATAAGTATSSAWASAALPITLIVVAIAAVGAAFILLYKRVDGFREVVDSAVDFVVQTFNTLKPALSAVWDVIVAGGKLVLQWIITPFKIAWSAIKAVVNVVAEVGKWIGGLVAPASAAGGSVLKLSDIVQGAVRFFRNLKAGIDGVTAALTSIGSSVGRAIEALGNFNLSEVYNILSNAGAAAGDAFKNGFDRSKVEALLGDQLDRARGELEKKAGTLPEGAQKQFENDIKLWQGQIDNILTSYSNARTDAERKVLEQRVLSTQNAIANLTNQIIRDTRKKTEDAAGGTPDLTPKVTPPNADAAKKDITDWTDKYISVVKASRDEIAAATVAGIADENARAVAAQRKANEDRIGTLKEQRDGILTEITKMRDAATPDKPFEIQIDFNQNNKIDPGEIIRSADAAGKLFTDIFTTRINTATAEGARQLAELQIKQIIDADKAAGDARIENLRQQESAVTGESLDAIQKRGYLRLQALQVQQDQETRALIAGLPAFKTAVAEIQKASVLDPSVDVNERIDALFDSFERTNPAVLQLQAVQNAARAKAEQEFLIQQEEKRISLIGDSAERERRTRELEARKTYAAELDAYKGSLELQKVAALKFAATLGDIRRQSAIDGNAALSGTLDFLSGFREDAYDQAARRDDSALKARLENIQKERQESLALYKAQTLGREEYSKRVRQLAAEESQVRQQLDNATFDVTQALNAGAAKSFEALGRKYSDSAAASLDQYVKLSATSEDELKKLGLTAKDVNAKMASALGDSAIAFGAIVGEAAVQGESILKASANTFLEVSAKLLEAQIPVWVASIFGSEVGKLGIAGIATAAVATAGLYALVGLAKSALAGVRLNKGGEVAPHMSAALGDVVPAMLTPTEIVVNPKDSARERDVILGINAGRSSRDIFFEKYGHSMEDREARRMATDLKRTVEKQGEHMGRMAAEMKDSVDRIEASNEKVAKRYERSTKVGVTGKVKTDRSGMTWTLEQARAEELMLS